MRLSEVEQIQKSVTPIYNNFGEWSPSAEYEAMRCLLIRHVGIVRDIDTLTWTTYRNINQGLMLYEQPRFSPYAVNGVYNYEVEISLKTTSTLMCSIVTILIPPHLIRDCYQAKYDEQLANLIIDLQRKVGDWIIAFPYLKATDVYQPMFIGGLIEHIKHQSEYRAIIDHLHGVKPKVVEPKGFWPSIIQGFRK